MTYVLHIPLYVKYIYKIHNLQRGDEALVHVSGYENDE